MSGSDVRSILSLPSSSAGPSAPRKSLLTARKPDGISRELYNLIGDNASSLSEAQAAVAAVKYKDRPKAKAKKVKWYVSTDG
jgi:DNA methyltransferase 1-associated protein 1